MRDYATLSVYACPEPTCGARMRCDRSAVYYACPACERRYYRLGLEFMRDHEIVVPRATIVTRDDA